MDLESSLRNMLGSEFEKAVAARIKSFHGLLTREVAIRLIAREKGLLKEEEKSYKLTDIPKDARKFGFSAEVRKVWPVAAYSSGKRSRVVEVGEGSATKPLVLWNEDVALADGLRTRDWVAVKGAYEKGGELHLGYSGSMEVEKKAAFSDLGSLQDGEQAHLRGVVAAIEGRTTGGFAFRISDGKNERRCVDGTGRAQKLREGDEVLLEDATVAGGDIELTASTRIFSRNVKDMLLGEVKTLECSGETLVAGVEARTVTLERQDALKLMGVDVAADIALSTVVALKKDYILNRRIALRAEEKDGRVRIKG